MDQYAIHRLHEFIPHLAKRQPFLLDLLPYDERPTSQIDLKEWVWSLSQRRLMEICSSWVVESIHKMDATSPLSAEALRVCLYLPGEFDVIDATSVIYGKRPAPEAVEIDRIHRSLNQLVHLGLLIHLADSDHYCLPFPVRLSIEGFQVNDQMEEDVYKERIIRYFSAIAKELFEKQIYASPKYWRFPNMLSAFEFNVDLIEKNLGSDQIDWFHDELDISNVPYHLARALLHFSLFFGRSLVELKSRAGFRLLSAGAVAAHAINRNSEEAHCLSLLGQFFFLRYEYGNSIRAYRQAEYIYKNIDDPIGHIIALGAIGIAHQEMGNRELAIQELLRARSVAANHQLHEKELDTANCAAKLLLEVGRAFESIKLTDELILKFNKESANFPSYAELLMHQGKGYRIIGEYIDAKRQLYSALALSKTSSHRTVESATYMEIGRVHLELFENREAGKWFHRALALYIELDDKKGQSEAYLALAETFLAEDNFHRAEEYLERSHRLARRLRAHEIIASVWELRAEIALAQEDKLMGLSHLHEVVACYRQTRETGLLIENHLKLAELYTDFESYLACCVELLRAQAIDRAFHPEPDKSSDIKERLESVHEYLSDEQFSHLVEEVTDELESGELYKGPQQYRI